jgi:hypothetical protein
MNTMIAIRMWKWRMYYTAAAVGITIGMNHQVVAQQPQSANEDGIEILTRGPVHEAFAETISFDPEPGMLIATAPPEPIEELAPDQRPEGANVTWIPGYWGWDDERNDFVWVSGIWRALPPGRQWIPGYWGKAQQGFQWTSGYWADATAREIEYLPEPPATVEAGPNIAATSADEIWIPGSWIWQQNRYAWRPGTWAPGNDNWIWVPDHYVWTPSGYVFVDGYYDHSVSRRGVVFAPVYFNRGLRTQRGFSYSPATVINPGVFVSHLFLRPSYGHYYFGDYYGPNYANAGFSPWFSYQSSRRGYDPIYANQRWQNRNDRRWEQRAEANYRNLRDNENARPPRNWSAQRERARRSDVSNQRNFNMAEPLNEWTQKSDAPVRLQPVNPAERQQYGQRGQQYRDYVLQRQQLETNSARTQDGTPTVTAGPQRRTFSRSPFVADPANQLGKDYTPPRRHEVLKPDLQVQPQPRMRGGQSGTRQSLNQGSPYGATGQAQDRRQGQRQRQGVNQGQQQGQDANRGDNRQGASNRQQQGPSNNSSQQGNSNRRQQSAAGGQAQSSPQQPAEKKSE